MLKIAVAGMQCSGKTTIAQMIVRNIASVGIDVSYVKFADPLYRVLEVMKQPKDRIFMQQFSDLTKKCFGKDFFTKRFVQTVDELTDTMPNGLIINDDMRYLRELMACKMLGFMTVFVDAGINNRIVRAEKVGLTFNDSHNSETEVHELQQYCDYAILNDGDLKALERVVASLCGMIRQRKQGECQEKSKLSLIASM